MKNSEGMTPIEVFNKDHKELLKVGEEAMKETANSCMLVATLISTVVFAAALCVPGASNQLNTPFLTKEEWFMIFVYDFCSVKCVIALYIYSIDSLVTFHSYFKLCRK